jgi:uncharacterized protein YndB with AHSA1/START domain/glutathione S-transferase
MSRIEIVGRSSSLFTRIPRIFAHELGVSYELVPVFDMTEVEAAIYSGNPALKIPSLRRNGSVLFGAENICRALADGSKQRIVWPEQLADDVSRNAMELVRHCCAAQVQWVFGTIVSKLPADNIYFAKGRTGFEGALRWLDDNLAGALAALPARDLSLFEVMLFCLVEHLPFRGTLPLAPYPSLMRFTEELAARPSAQRTPYHFDATGDRDIVSARVLAAPRERVFAALTDARQLARWWGPAGFTNTVEQLDLRPAGQWRVTMRGPDGAEYPNEWEFVEIAGPERLVARHLRPMHSFLLTMTLAEQGAQTLLTWHMVFEDAAERERVKDVVSAANEQNFDRLAALLSGAR